jgi:hypothetical protein
MKIRNHIFFIGLFLWNIPFLQAQVKQNELFVAFSPFDGGGIKSVFGTAVLNIFDANSSFKTKSIGFYTLGYQRFLSEKTVSSVAISYTGNNISIKTTDKTIEGKSRAIVFSLGLNYIYYSGEKTQFYSGLKYVSSFYLKSVQREASGGIQIEVSDKTAPIIGQGSLTLLGFRYGRSKGIFSEINIGSTLFNVGLFGKF